MAIKQSAWTGMVPVDDTALAVTDRPILAGWSYGALVAAHWASRHPDRIVGAVLVDGVYPYDWLDEAMEQWIRKLYRRPLSITRITEDMTSGFTFSRAARGHARLNARDKRKDDDG
jgi:pimeloyl-ACP methyl ester carboxylesterase